MEEWIDCSDFIEADVIRFSDAVWERKGPKSRQKALKIGAREITAEVVEIFKDGEGLWVVLKIVRCVVIDDRTGGRLVHPLKEGEEIKRLKTSLLKWGKPVRLPWSDEHNREMRVADQTGPTPRRRKRD